MSADQLHDALRDLAPIAWEDVPQDDLSTFLTNNFTSSTLLCDSIPPPPLSGNSSPSDPINPHFTTPNTATTAKETHNSAARSPIYRADRDALRKHWGKPIKLKTNPLDVALYKMAGADRHGAWFARHSVHEGIGFAKMKRAMQREFADSLLVQGGAGAGAKRGLAADRRLERRDVDGVGRMEVYQLSAAFPPPVTARDFNTLFMTSDRAGEAGEEGRKAPRQFVICSKPVEHPDAPPRSTFVRGKYESVEMIREFPLKTKGGEKVNGDGGAVSGAGEDDEAELNPVEWIMITRSDPGGGIPRFLVDRGTPDAMIGDVTKFLDWACSYSDIPDADADADAQAQTSARAGQQIQEGESQPSADPAAEAVDKSAREAAAPAVVAKEQDGGVMSNLTQSMEAGIAAYAPAPVSNYVSSTLHPATTSSRSSSITSSSDAASFTSAAELHRQSTAAPGDPAEEARPSTDNLSLANSETPSQSGSKADQDLAKITSKRAKLDQQLAKKRAAEQSKLDKAAERDASEQDKARERMEREIKKTEERHARELAKLEAKREKETRKAEERRRKRDEGGRLSLVARERDDARGQLEAVRKENGVLLEQVEGLQRRVAELEGGAGGGSGETGRSEVKG